MELAKFNCVIDNTDPGCQLGCEMWLNDQCFFQCDHVLGPTSVTHQFSDTNATHELRIVLKGKKGDHTQVSDTGEIIRDARLIIKDVTFDEIALGHVFFAQSTYQHDFNGTGPVTEEKFYGEIGCNGVVTMRFKTPMYLWFLETM